MLETAKAVPPRAGCDRAGSADRISPSTNLPAAHQLTTFLTEHSWCRERLGSVRPDVASRSSGCDEEDPLCFAPLRQHSSHRTATPTCRLANSARRRRITRSHGGTGGDNYDHQRWLAKRHPGGSDFICSADLLPQRLSRYAQVLGGQRAVAVANVEHSADVSQLDFVQRRDRACGLGAVL